MNIKEYYLENYPTDEMGIQIDSEANFFGLLKSLIIGNDVYEYIGTCDSIIRERLFEKLAKDMNVNYGYVYKLWLKF